MARQVKWYGYNPPFLTRTEVLSPQSDLRLIKNDILQLLLTSPGERVMRPNFGTIIRKLPFDPNDSSTRNNLRDNIFQAISRYEPRVTVRDVIIQSDDNRGTITVTVYAFLKSDPNKTMFPVEAEFISSTRNPGAPPTRNSGGPIFSQGGA